MVEGQPGNMLMPHESEDIERAELEAMHAAAGPALTGQLRLALLARADGIASIAPTLPARATVINRALGLGLAQTITPETVRQIRDAYTAAGIGRFFLHVHPDAAGEHVAAACEAAGLARARGWQKFERGAVEPIPEPAPDLEIREIGPDHGVAFARIVCDAFDLSDDAVPWLACVPGQDGFRIFVAFVEGEPAGTGGLFIRGDAAWTDFGATAPAHRRRGIQRALLAHRVREALRQGCERLYTCTGEAVPGDPQHSFNNIKRCGFRETYIRENWAPPKP
jgi:GNAT superfamily N-acetyltransferase